MSYKDFLNYVEVSEKKIIDYIMQNYRKNQVFKPKIIDECVMTYIKRGGKRLRPIVLLMACGAVGGIEDIALPAAVAIELFHTWTLVHDDLIDNDNLRRGQPTVHLSAKNIAIKDQGFSEAKAVEYGRDIAVLTGDIQHGWSISMFTDPQLLEHVNSNVIFTLINKIQTHVLHTLVHGEVLDVEFGMRGNGILDISEDDILKMLWMKTGVLYEFAGLAGAMIGKNSIDISDPEISSIQKFCSSCGTAFQLRDDILGIIGREADLGKPVGSDIREGKKTTIIRTALLNASQKESELIHSILGKHTATDEEIKKVTNLLIDLGGIQYTYELSVKYVNKALPHLSKIRTSQYKTLLEKWAKYMIERKY